MRNIPFGKPIIGEEEKQAVLEVLNGSILVHGPRSKQFEADFGAFTKARNAVSVSSCTAAMHLYYFYLGIGPGDEVIVPAQTHAATAHTVELTGAKPVFVDSDRATGNIDAEQAEYAITENTRVITVVHFLGTPVNMERIMAVARKHNLRVLEDCALAIGTTYKGIHAGLHGDVGCFSFYPVKHMTTAEGGMLITNNEDVAVSISKQKAFGVDRHIGERELPGMYDVKTLGFNYRLNEIQAVLGIEQLKRIDSFLKKREENYLRLEEGLKEIDEIEQFQSSHDEYQSSYYCLSILLNESLSKKRYEIINYFKENGIGTSIYYPKPVPHMTYYREKYGYSETSYPEAARVSYSSIALPVGPHLGVEDMEYICVVLKDAIMEVK